MGRVFSTAMPVVLAGEVRQSKRRRRAAVDGEDFVSGTLCEAICLGASEPALAVPGCSPPLPSWILSSGPCSSAPSKKRGDFRFWRHLADLSKSAKVRFAPKNEAARAVERCGRRRV